jgi:uncharacterized phage protein (TIGR01671 family)
MREIKFRTWEYNTWTKRNKFYYYTLRDLHIARTTVGNGYDKFPNDEDAETTQYTGLKDKNDKEIYEGDIVKATSDQYTNENFVGKVIFDEGSFLTWINKNDIRGVWSGDDIEVIGNIFENKDLLEKEQ